MRNHTVMNHSVKQRLIYSLSIYSLCVSIDPFVSFFGSTCDRAVAVPADANTDRVAGDGCECGDRRNFVEMETDSAIFISSSGVKLPM